MVESTLKVQFYTVLSGPSYKSHENKTSCLVGQDVCRKEQLAGLLQALSSVPDIGI
jgi:hypothetical protein